MHLVVDYSVGFRGREFRRQHLTRIVDDSSVGSERYHSKDALLSVLEEASAAFVVEWLERELGLFSFTHSVLQQTFS